MGRAMRWLRNLLGGKKESKGPKEHSNYGAEVRRERTRRSFGKPATDSSEGTRGQNPSTEAVETAWLRSVYAESEKEQSKHAIAVAAATAAAADAAVAAAQAAVAVVRLTSQGRGTMFGGREQKAAEKIQTAFRGYLARKAFRALKALVKLQALVRGYLVRKQAAATLQSMQALIRAQENVRAQKSRNLLLNDRRFPPEFRPRRSLERFDDARSEHLASVHSRRLSASLDNAYSGFDRSPKIVEIDTYRPRSRSSRRTSPSVLDLADDAPPQPISSPLPCHLPNRISIPDCRNFEDYDWCLAAEKCRFSATAQSTPRYMSSTGNNMPVTPTKSLIGADGIVRRFLNSQHCPSYMANTQSFEAKVRSQSAPKLRPEPAGPTKRLPLSEVMMESRASLSGIGMRRSCTQVREAFNFKNAVVDRLDRSLELARDAEKEFYLQRKW